MQMHRGLVLAILLISSCSANSIRLGDSTISSRDFTALQDMNISIMYAGHDIFLPNRSAAREFLVNADTIMFDSSTRRFKISATILDAQDSQPQKDVMVYVGTLDPVGGMITDSSGSLREYMPGFRAISVLRSQTDNSGRFSILASLTPSSKLILGKSGYFASVYQVGVLVRDTSAVN
jgi:hypothetical protein